MEIRVRIIPDTMVYADSIPVRAPFYRNKYSKKLTCYDQSRNMCSGGLSLWLES
jgi:hypothetical protein